MSATPLLHVALRDEYEAALAEGATHYAPAAFPAEGFVHLCRSDQLAGVLGRYFLARDDLMLLALDADRFDATLREEDTTGRGEAFPHLYGPIPFAAVQAAREIRTDAAGGLLTGDAPDATPPATTDPAALERAACTLAEQYRDGVFIHLGSLMDPATGDWLCAELARRCPGFEAAAYQAALADAFEASR